MSAASYGSRHMQAGLAALGRLARNPFSTVLTVLVIGLALSLPLSLKLLVTNARAASGDFATAVDLSVYLKAGTPLEKARQLARSARSRPGVAEVELIAADAALAEFRQHSGFGAALEALEDNPLPHLLHVRPASEASTPAALENLRRYFAAWPEVEIVQIDSEWVLRFNAILEVLRRSLFAAAILLGAGVLAVVGNTIRLEIANRRAEIEVTKLIGASNGFVRRPFLYTGALYGMVGALVAWALIALGIALLYEPVARLASLYGSRFSLAGPSRDDIGALLLAGALLGWLGAWLSASRHLRSIDPRA